MVVFTWFRFFGLYMLVKWGCCFCRCYSVLQMNSCVGPKQRSSVNGPSDIISLSIVLYLSEKSEKWLILFFCTKKTGCGYRIALLLVKSQSMMFVASLSSCGWCSWSSSFFIFKSTWASSLDASLFSSLEWMFSLYFRIKRLMLFVTVDERSINYILAEFLAHLAVPAKETHVHIWFVGFVLNLRLL